jgi:predicted PurR-regulated permease PerM
MPEADRSRDITRIVFSVLFIAALLGLSIWILKPFLPALLWATTIALATWPLMRKVQAVLWGRRSLAVAVMTGALLLIFILPFSVTVGALVTNAADIAEKTKILVTVQLPPLPEWVIKVPFLGDRLSVAWHELAETGLAEEVRPYLGALALWFAGSVGSVGAFLVQFLLTVLITGILYSSGESAAETVRRFAVRLAGAQGEAAVRLAGQAVRAVALGVVVTALVQSVIGGVGLLVAGVPFVAVLTAVMFMLSLAQLPPLIVLVPAVAWLYWTGSTGWATFLLVWTLLLAPVDNVLKPVLIKRGADLSILLVFSGVVGGLMAFGLVGIFIGPVVLAVSSTLISAWMDAGLAQAAAAAPGASGPADAGAPRRPE